MLDIEIREWLAQYLSSQVSLREFQEWFVPATWEIDQSDNLDARELANEIELRLAEYTSGHLSEEQLLREFKRFITTDYQVTISFGTASETVMTRHFTSSQQNQRQSFGILSSMELV